MLRRSQRLDTPVEPVIELVETAHLPVDTDDLIGSQPSVRFTAWQKLRSIQETLRDVYRWSVPDLVHIYLTQEAEEDYHDSLQTRRSKLAKVVFRDAALYEPFVESARSNPQQKAEIALYTLGGFRDEQDDIRQAIGAAFDSDESITVAHLSDKSRVSELAEKLQQVAPQTWGIFNHLVKNVRLQERTGQEDKATNHSARIATILAILSMCQARQKGNAFQRRFGLYLHGQGTRRDAISVLHAMGLCESYEKSTHRRRRALGCVERSVKWREWEPSGAYEARLPAAPPQRYHPPEGLPTTGFI